MHTNINFQRQWVNDLMKLNNTHFKSTHIRSHLLPCIECLDDSDQKKVNFIKVCEKKLFYNS